MLRVTSGQGRSERQFARICLILSTAFLGRRTKGVRYEAIRHWCRKFGSEYARRLKRREGRLGKVWYLDEIFVKVQGRQMYLWRAVDEDGDALDILVQSHRYRRAGKRFFRKLLKGHGAVADTEAWEIFAYDGDQRLVHSELRFAERRTEVWQRLDAEGRTTFVEITRDGPGERSRSRYWIEDGELRSITRGNTTGIIEQTARLPEDWTVLLPVAAATIGMGSEVRQEATKLAALRLAGAGSPATGLIEPMELRPVASRELATAGGSVAADGFECHTAGGVTSWYVHPELGVPLLGTQPENRQIVLADLHVVEPAPR